MLVSFDNPDQLGQEAFFSYFFRISMDFPSQATDCAPNYLKLQGIN